MPEFFQTVMGHRFYESTMPSIARSLEKIAETLTPAHDEQPVLTPNMEAILTKIAKHTTVNDWGAIGPLDSRDIDYIKGFLEGLKERREGK
jgi:hypothetical protein